MRPRKVTATEIRSYYRSTFPDYRDFWMDNDNLSMHFGYRDRAATDHAASLIKANEVLADLTKIGAGDRVLDAGCGIGGGSLWLAKNRGLA